MKSRCFLLYLALTTQAWSVQQTFPEFASPSDKAILNRITDQVNSGNYNALYDAAKLPAPVAIQYLYLWTAPANSSPQVGVVSQALKQVSGYADYLREDMASVTAQGRVPVGDFEVAELINTPEAAAVLAPYLFDFKTITPQEGDLAGDSNVNEALYTLTQMKLTGAPLSKSPGISNSAYLMEWQRWAIAKGFVPQSWSSRVGAPASWLKLDAIERQPPTLIHSKSSQQTPPSASPSLPTPTNTPSPSPAPSVSATKAPSGSTFTTWGAVVLVLLIIGGVVVMLKRRP